MPLSWFGCLFVLGASLLVPLVVVVLSFSLKYVCVCVCVWVCRLPLTDVMVAGAYLFGLGASLMVLVPLCSGAVLFVG